MQPGKLRRELMCLAGLTIAALASGAAPPATPELGEIGVEGTREHERRRVPDVLVGLQAAIRVEHKASARFEVWIFMNKELLPNEFTLPSEFSFRRGSRARQQVQETHVIEVSQSVRGSGSAREEVVQTLRPSNQPIPLYPYENVLDPPHFILQSNVDEADGLPASIPFGAQASLINVDYLRLRDIDGAVGIKLTDAIHPQTRRCSDFTVLDDGTQNPNRFVLLADSNVACRRIERSREGDLIFAASVPDVLRQVVRDTYEPIDVRAANWLGSEPGLVFVALWADSPHRGFRLEESWNRNLLLLFNGAAGQQGVDPAQREALRAGFVEEQIRRRVRQADAPGLFTESAARYLMKLFTAVQDGDVGGWLADSLPGWIHGCAGDLQDKARIAAVRGDVSSIDCGLVLQFVYDAVARANSAGRDSLFDTWRRLLGESYRRGESGVQPAAFLESSRQARGIVQGLLDGSVDWNRFVADLGSLGVGLRLSQDAPQPDVAVLSLTHFSD
jgi:hypothetical protein